MKTTIQFAILSCFCWGNVAFGSDAEIVYIDSGLISYYQLAHDTNSIASVYVYEKASAEIRKHFLLGSTYPTSVAEDLYMSRFPLAWSVKNKHCV